MMLGFVGVLVRGQMAWACSADGESVPCHRTGAWWVAESSHFSVWSKVSAAESISIAHRSEQLRSELQKCWLMEDVPQWRCRCHVVIHPDLAAYRGLLPGESSASVGCTTITTDHGEVIFRRIDLRSDVMDWEQNALPHEMTHVILADRFPRERLPIWLNEGLAMLSEQPALRARRDQVLRAALSRGAIPSLRLLLQQDGNLERISPELAYAVHSSIVFYLERIGGRQRLGEFAELMLHTDCETALNEIFALSGGIDELERRWRTGFDSRLMPGVRGRASSSSTEFENRASKTSADSTQAEPHPRRHNRLISALVIHGIEMRADMLVPNFISAHT
jgi:hypothetical protein